MTNFYEKLRILLIAIFGSLHWNLPPWLKRLQIIGKNQWEKTKKGHRNHPKRTKVALSGFVITTIIAAGGYYWYSNRPQPVKMAVSLSNISLTPLEKDAVPDQLEVTFGGSAAKLADIGKVVTEGVQIQPEIPGQWEWKEDNRLVFTIAGNWPIGGEHQVVLESSLFPKHITLEKYNLDFKTPSFELRILSADFYQNPNNSKDKKIVAEVKFSHPVEKSSFEKRISFKYVIGQGTNRKTVEKKLGFKAQYDEFLGKAFLHTDNLAIPNYESKVEFTINKGVESKNGGGGTDYEVKDSSVVPGMLTHFRFQEAELTLVRNEKYEPEQALILQASTDMKQIDLSNHLEVFVLPKDRQPQPGTKKESKNFNWTVHTVSQEVLKKSTKLDLEEIPTENEYAKIMSYKYKEEPGRFLYISVKKNLKAFGGYKLPETKTFVLRVPKFPKELNIMGKGSLLSLVGEKKISILARDMTAVRYRARRVLPGQLAHFVSQGEGSFGNPNFNGSIGLDNVTETFSTVKSLPKLKHGKTQYSFFDFNKTLNRIAGKPKGLFYFTAEGWDKSLEAQRGPSDSRMILVTDIGILVKKSISGQFDLFLQSISTGLPLSGVKVEVLGKNGLPILSETSGSNGKVEFLDLSGFKDEKEPVVFVAQKGSDFSFLPVDKQVHNLNYSRFDIGGVHSDNAGASLDAYVFSDRGIYRPGETVNIGYVVKDGDWSRNLSGVELQLKITDPRGNLIRHEKKLPLNQVGLKSYEFKTGATWSTGYYTFNLYVKRNKHRLDRIGSVQVKVEEFMPDRLKIAARFSRPSNKGWLNPKDLTGIVSLKNLFGTAAQKRRVKGQLNLSPTYPSFRSLREWTFFDPMRAEKSFDEPLGEKVTDDEGMVTFDLGLSKFESASYLLRFVAEGFEAEGGRSVFGSNSVLISPLDFLVGYKKGGDLSYIKKGANVGVQFIAIDNDLNLIDAKDLKLKIIEFKKVSTLVKQHDGTYKYESVKKEYERSTSDFSIQKSKNTFKIDSSKPGDFAIVITNVAGLELNRVQYSVVGASNLSFDLERSAELQVKLNKKDFLPGEEIEISIRAPYVGAGLITIEREKVYVSKWFKTNTKSSLQKITIPKDLEGNGYVNVSFVRSLSSDEIFMSPLSSGVAPFSIDKSSRINELTLKIPPLVRPGKDLKINVKAARAGKALVFAVDEGILQVANYKNPDPLNHFYKKKALEVGTRQILDLIMPEFAKLSINRSSDGGGMADSQLGKNMNPFQRLRDKSVAYWSGLVDVGPKAIDLTYNVPDHFSGQLRVIAVVVSADSMDAAVDKTLVKGHFVLSPNLPNFVAPGDQLEISVGVSNGVEKSGKQAEVEVELGATNNIKIVGESKRKIKIDEGGEASLSFDIIAQEPLGNASFTFTARLKDKSSRRTVTSSVRPAAPYITSLLTGYVDGGSTKDLKTPRRVYKEFRTNEVSVSKLPLSLAQGFMTYLEKYPYGCTEQITSKGFPSIIFSSYKEFKPKAGSASEQLQGITELYAARQLPDGGFSMWPGGGEVNAFHTAYAVHFLTEAKARGFRVPKDLMDRALEYLKEYSAKEPKNLSMARVQSYAAYLLTRNEIIATQSLSSLEKWLEGYKDENWVKDILLVYMAASYKNMKAVEKAQTLLAKFDDAEVEISDYHYGVYNDAIKRSAHLYLVAKHFPERIGEFNGEKLQILVDKLQGGLNTTSSALAILAFEAFAKNSPGDLSEGIRVTENLSGKSKLLDLDGGLFPKSNFSHEADQVSIKNTNESLAYFSLVQAGFDTAETAEIKNGVEVFREFLDKEGNKMESAVIGDQITVQLRMRTLENSSFYNMAVVDLLPGGFEVVLDSLDRSQSAWDYVDAREDRVLLFTHFNKEVKTFEYKIKAINKGTYKVPPVFAESMYDKKIQTKGLSGKMTVQ